MHFVERHTALGNIHDINQVSPVDQSNCESRYDKNFSWKFCNANLVPMQNLTAEQPWLQYKLLWFNTMEYYIAIASEVFILLFHIAAVFHYIKTFKII